MNRVQSQSDESKIIQFDDDGNAILTEEQMVQLIRQTGYLSFITSHDKIPAQCYVLINKKLSEAHLLPAEELEEWENDGSCEPGDHLYKIEFIKKY